MDGRGVHRIVNTDAIHAEMVERPDVDGERHVELFRLSVDRPVNFRAEVAFNALAVRRQHGADHA